jgi:glutamyl-Q tRNA(Asp) synthetase
LLHAPHTPHKTLKPQELFFIRMPPQPIYRGRFAPSPTGPLHFGSLVAAVGSYLDARSQRGQWLLRMEDIDAPRCSPAWADDILRTLEMFGLHWDGEVVWQQGAGQQAAYREALAQLKLDGQVFACACTRRELADSQLAADGAVLYPGTCRAGLPAGKTARAWRVRVDFVPHGKGVKKEGNAAAGTPRTATRDSSCIVFDDAVQGRIQSNLITGLGDFIVCRADGFFAYQLAVVVDDAAAGITHVVRGADLLVSTPRQIFLQRCLGVPMPHYAHLPVAVNAAGEKLAKQTLAKPLDKADPGRAIHAALQFLGQQPPPELATAQLDDIWSWAKAHWQLQRVPKKMMQPVQENF